MGSAYTPGLTVSGDIIVRRLRRLPIKGTVLVKIGDPVEPHSVVAQALLPGPLQTVKVAETLGLEAKDALELLTVKVGDAVEIGQMIAETKGFMGKFKRQLNCTATGTIESISDITGNFLVREASIPIDVTAYIHGKIADVMPEEGATVETRCAMVQGIFGVGGERTGTIRVVTSDPKQVLEANLIQDSDKGKILIGGSGITFDAIKRAEEVGAIGLVAGGIKDSDLTKYLGYEIGVAITGQEAIPLTLMVSEGFGFLAMADRTFKLLQSLEGKTASINGATQIRAGVIRPEIIVPITDPAASQAKTEQPLELKIGTPIRIIREPYFGRLGQVTELPPTLVVVESGTEVRVLQAKLDDGQEAVVPRANVEIIAT